MSYDIEEIERYCSGEGFSYVRKSAEEIRVQICKDMELCFANIDQGADTLLGFSGFPWHAHGDLLLMTGESSYVELNPIDILTGLKSGELLICSSFSMGEVKDRWIFHRKEKQDFQYLEADESIIIQTAEQGGAPHAHPRHAPCLSLRSGTSRATDGCR